MSWREIRPSCASWAGVSGWTGAVAATGTIEADSQAAVAQKLSSLGYATVTITEHKAELLALGDRSLMDEPLHRHYANLAWLRGHVNRARHLSLARWFLGSEGMASLGLPRSAPWYPMILMLPMALCAVSMAASPRLRHTLALWGRQRQRSYLKVLTGRP